MPLIIFRYITRQMLQVMLAVTSVVLLIIMSGRFVNYLAQAASGSLKADYLFAIMGYRMPEFLVMIIPLGLFLGIILAYGRLYVESEMSVLSACGMSRNQLLLMTMIPAAGVMMFVALLSLYIAPIGIQRVEQILADQDSLTEFDTLVPGRFQMIDNGLRSTYTEKLSDDRQRMEQVFIANRNIDSNNIGEMTVLLSETGRIDNQQEGDGEGQKYLILQNGYRYDLTPGQLKLRATKFEAYGIQMQESSAKKEISREQALPTSVLLASDDTAHIAELQWRISLPLLIPIMVLLAVALAKVSPRQGRFVKLLPGILLYLFYLALLISSRGAVDDGRIPAAIGLWWVHSVFLMIALILYFYEPVQLKLAKRRAMNA